MNPREMVKLFVHFKYKSIARARCLVPAESFSKETIGENVILMTSGAKCTVSTHLAWL